VKEKEKKRKTKQNKKCFIFYFWYSTIVSLFFRINLQVFYMQMYRWHNENLISYKVSKINNLRRVGYDTLHAAYNGASRALHTLRASLADESKKRITIERHDNSCFNCTYIL